MTLSDKISKTPFNMEFIESKDVREAVKELIKSFETSGLWTREGAIKYIKEIFGEKLIWVAEEYLKD